MKINKKTTGRSKTALAAALISAFAVWLCCAPPARAQQWTTSTNSSNNINNTNSGNVGVGTSAPQAKLDVEGSSAYGVSGVFSAVYAKGTADYPMALMLDGAGTGDNIARLRALNNGQTKWQLNFGDDLLFANWLNSTFNTRFSVTAAGNVGIGTTAPSDRLSVYASKTPAATSAPDSINLGASFSDAAGANLKLKLYDDGSNVGGLGVSSGQVDYRVWSAGASHVFYQGTTELMRVQGSGNVGIGTAAPLQRLQVGTNSSAATSAPDAISLGATYSSTAGANAKLRLWDNNTGDVFGLGVSASQLDFMVPTGARYVWSVNGAEKMRLDESGNVTVAGNIAAKYQDVAEWVPSSQKLSAGTVVVLDTKQTNHVLASTKSYDTAVAGVVSDSPGVILGEGSEGKLKVATTGRVRVRVDATHAPIQAGDLLVTSDIEGVAMKSVPIDLGGTQIHRPGTIIGKALESLEKGTGEILVLLSLQ
jgi:hypothetical protein